MIAIHYSTFAHHLYNLQVNFLSPKTQQNLQKNIQMSDLSDFCSSIFVKYNGTGAIV